MTVAELIKKLSSMTPDKEIILIYDCGHGSATCDVVEEEENEVLLIEL